MTLRLGSSARKGLEENSRLLNSFRRANVMPASTAVDFYHQAVLKIPVTTKARSMALRTTSDRTNNPAPDDVMDPQGEND